MILESDFNVVYENLPTTIGAFIRETDNFYTVVLNSRLTHERNLESFFDEYDHMEKDAFALPLCADQIESKSHQGGKFDETAHF